MHRYDITVKKDNTAKVSVMAIVGHKIKSIIFTHTHVKIFPFNAYTCHDLIFLKS